LASPASQGVEQFLELGLLSDEDLDEINGSIELLIIEQLEVVQIILLDVVSESESLNIFLTDIFLISTSTIATTGASLFVILFLIIVSGLAFFILFLIIVSGLAFFTLFLIIVSGLAFFILFLIIVFGLAFFTLYIGLSGGTSRGIVLFS
jgi:hypothetical protein